MATTTNRPKISVNGEPYELGELNEWIDNGLLDWGGVIYGAHRVGQKVTIFVETDSWVRAGEALITGCELSRQPVSHFRGEGELLMWHKATLDELRAKWDAEHTEGQ